MVRPMVVSASKCFETPESKWEVCFLTGSCLRAWGSKSSCRSRREILIHNVLGRNVLMHSNRILKKFQVPIAVFRWTVDDEMCKTEKKVSEGGKCKRLSKKLPNYLQRISFKWIFTNIAEFTISNNILY